VDDTGADESSSGLPADEDTGDADALPPSFGADAATADGCTVAGRRSRLPLVLVALATLRRRRRHDR